MKFNCGVCKIFKLLVSEITIGKTYIFFFVNCENGGLVFKELVILYFCTFIYMIIIDGRRLQTLFLRLVIIFFFKLTYITCGIHDWSAMHICINSMIIEQVIFKLKIAKNFLFTLTRSFHFFFFSCNIFLFLNLFLSLSLSFHSFHSLAYFILEIRACCKENNIEPFLIERYWFFYVVFDSKIEQPSKSKDVTRNIRKYNRLATINTSVYYTYGRP